MTKTRNIIKQVNQIIQDIKVSQLKNLPLDVEFTCAANNHVLTPHMEHILDEKYHAVLWDASCDFLQRIILSKVGEVICVSNQECRAELNGMLPYTIGAVCVSRIHSD